MTVISFSCARFTPSDVVLFHRVADPRLADGRWAALRRHSGKDNDRLEVYLPETRAPQFRFERNAHGRYALSMRDKDEWHVIATGASATECLGIWMTRDAD